MSSRQEEKERRKRERQEREAAEKASAARRKRMQMVFGGVLAVVAVVGVVAALVARRRSAATTTRPTTCPRAAAAIPAQQEVRPQEGRGSRRAARSRTPPNEGSGHDEKDFKASDYKQNPPTSGNHFPQWYQDGIYAPGDTPELGKLVHTLEHGRIDIQYTPGTPATTVAQLETFFNEIDGRLPHAALPERRRRCRSRSPRPPGTTSSAARR